LLDRICAGNASELEFHSICKSARIGLIVSGHATKIIKSTRKGLACISGAHPGGQNGLQIHIARGNAAALALADRLVVADTNSAP